MRARRCTLSAEIIDRATAAGFRPVPRAVLALGVFAAVRLTGLLVMAGWAWHIGRSPRMILARAWDADWYMLIAAHGYGRTLRWPGGVVQSDLAFFPLYPALVRTVTAVVPVTGGTAGLVISWSAAAAAAWGIYAVVERLHGQTTATLAVLLWGLLPHSIVLSMAYTEPLLTALAAWSLYAVLTRRWVWAGVLAALAGACRPNGIAIAAAVVAVAAYEVWQRRGSAGWQVWTAAALAPLGWCGYVLYVGLRKGDLFGGYFAVQRGWTSRFDFGVGALKAVRGMLTRPPQFTLVVALMIVAAAVLLFVLLSLDRPPLPLVVYTAVLVLITVGGSGFFESKPRFLLPAFPLLLPLAHAMTKARPSAAVTVTVALAGLSFAYGTYLLTLSPMAL